MRASPILVTCGVMAPLRSFFVIPDGYPLNIVGEKYVQKGAGVGASQKPKCSPKAYPPSVMEKKMDMQKKGTFQKKIPTIFIFETCPF
jgi:hypothetical protein